jgi:phosphoribosylaminoimidazolecarboxamide formyltransferase / IMP cyclohydrolase
MPTALLSVYDKTGVVELAEGLHGLGWRLLSSGGTAKAIQAAGIDVTDVAELTGFPAILGHRVVTLHPKVHGGLLADVTNPEHLADMEAYGIEPIDLVVVNLYPFASDPGIELIDIGGPSMVRSAAKNHARVGVVVNPVDYTVVLEEIRSSGELSAATKRRLARDAFASTAAYDTEITAWLAGDTGAGASGAAPILDADGEPSLPATLTLEAELAQPLRYGENPHQQGARYRFTGKRSWWDDAVQHGGKELSYLNVFDTEAAWKLVQRFERPAVVIVKHANPCGVAVHDDIVTAYRLAHEADPVSAFGGIVAVNRPVPAALAEALAPVFTEVVVAPGFDAAALATLTAKKNLRVLSASAAPAVTLDIRSLDGGLLVQDADTVAPRTDAWQVVTAAQPTDAHWADLEFAWQVCAAVSSNAIVFAKDLQALGIGAGQQNRVDSVRIAATRSAGRANGGVLASDAFFPFRDNIDVAAEAGIKAIIQPGGSIRDQDSIDACNEHGIAMVVTGTRHFRH